MSASPLLVETHGQTLWATMNRPQRLNALNGCLVEAAVAMEDRNQILCAQGEDFGEGVAAFLQKRPPVYRPGTFS